MLTITLSQSSEQYLHHISPTYNSHPIKITQKLHTYINYGPPQPRQPDTLSRAKRPPSGWWGSLRHPRRTTGLPVFKNFTPGGSQPTQCPVISDCLLKSKRSLHIFSRGRITGAFSGCFCNVLIFLVAIVSISNR